MAPTGIWLFHYMMPMEEVNSAPDGSELSAAREQALCHSNKMGHLGGLSVKSD